MVGFVRKGRGKEEVEARQGRFGDVEGKILVIGEGRRWYVDRVSGGRSKGVEIVGCRWSWGVGCRHDSGGEGGQGSIEFVAGGVKDTTCVGRGNEKCG